MTDLDHRLAAAESTALAVGKVALNYFQRHRQLAVESKGASDYVSEADRAAEAVARRDISRLFPGDSILGEEDGGTLSPSSWVIDPIDGTTNFLNGLPIWAVSVAYLRDGVPVVGAVALPALGMLFSAADRRSLKRNGEVWETAPNPHARLAGIGRNPTWLNADYRAVETRIDAAGFTLVSLGSCAAELAFTAAGHLSGYVQNHIKLWDAAAGIVLCKAAGLTVEWRPDEANSGDIVVGQSQFLDVVSGGR